MYSSGELGIRDCSYEYNFRMATFSLGVKFSFVITLRRSRRCAH